MAEKENTDELLYQIITDRRYISATDSTGNTVDLTVRSLTLSERLYADFLYKQALAVGKRQGLLSNKQLMADAIVKGLWTDDKEKLKKLYQTEIEQLEKQKALYKKSGNKGKQQKFHMSIIKVRLKLEELEREEATYIINSLELHAERQIANYSLSRMMLNVSGEQVWPTHDSFLQENDSVLLSSIIQSTNQLKPIVEKHIRKLARNSIWSIMWGTSKTSGEPLFGKPSTKYTSEQTLLCYWSMMYDSVYESMERPSDRVIDDDEALDKWFKEQRENRDKTTKQRNIAKKDIFDGHKVGAGARQEHFVMVDSDAEADDVYDINDKWGLAEIQYQIKKVESSQNKYVTEHEIRGPAINRKIMLASSDRVAAARKNSARSPRFLG